MTTVDVYWKPFAAKGFTVQETAQELRWACLQFETICGFKYNFVGTNRGRVYVYGKAENSFAGNSSYLNIWISTTRNLGIREHSLGSVMVHELAHGGPGFNTPNLKHPIEGDHPQISTLHRDYMMHPWLSSTDWWSPEEVGMMRDKYGPAERPFNPYPIAIRGKELREIDAELKELRSKREKLVKDRATLPTKDQRVAAHKEILKLNPIIGTKHSSFVKRIEDWRSFVERWKGTKGSIILGEVQ